MKASIINMVSSPLLLLALLAMTSNAQLANIPTKLMRARFGATGSGNMDVVRYRKTVLDRGRRPTPTSSSSRRRRMKGDNGGGLRQFMSMDMVTETVTATTKTSTTTSTSATTTTTTTTTTTSDEIDRQVDDGVISSDMMSSLTASPTTTEILNLMPSSSPIVPTSTAILTSAPTTTATAAATTETTTTPTPEPTSITSSMSNDVSSTSSNPPFSLDDGSLVTITTTTSSPTPFPSTTTTTTTSKVRYGPIQTTGLTISLVGMTSIPNRYEWESTTSSYFMSVYNNSNNNKSINNNNDDDHGSTLNSGITNAKVQISITNVAFVPSSTSHGSQRRKRQRGLSTHGNNNENGGVDTATQQQQHTNDDMSVQVTYTQTMWYTTTTTTAEMEDSSSKNATATTNAVIDDDTTTTLVQYPLSTPTYRDEYVGQLKRSLDGYEDLTAVSSISIRVEKAEYAESAENNKIAGGNLSLGAVIGMAAGGAALLTILGIIVYVNFKECRSKEVVEYDDDDDGEEEFDSSTTNHRQYRNSTTTGGQTLDGGCSTVDYDYRRPGAHGAGAAGGDNYAAGGVSGLSYISDAMGTLGSRRSRRTGAAEQQEDDRTAVGNQTIFSDDPTYIQPRYNDGSIDGNDDQNYMVREEMLEVYAPSGKLGVVIDNPDGRNPTIHAVKDTSPIASQVRVGDRVVAVDDEDVRGMSAMRVSRLISRKSGNVSRKFTIIRHVRC